QRSRAHRDVHSFPTRRSSDLDQRQQCGGQRQVLVVKAVVADLLWIDRSHADLAWQPGATKKDRAEAPAARCLSRCAWLLVGRQLDRKSTRLNSSHVSISYAVF